MTLQDYLNSKESKYAVIRADSYEQDPVAQSISQSPRRFMFGDVEMVILSLEPSKVQELIAYVESVANGVEWELTIGSGKVTMLTHEQTIALLHTEHEEYGH